MDLTRESHMNAFYNLSLPLYCSVWTEGGAGILLKKTDLFLWDLPYSTCDWLVSLVSFWTAPFKMPLQGGDLLSYSVSPSVWKLQGGTLLCCALMRCVFFFRSSHGVISCPLFVFTCVLFVNQHCVYSVSVLPDVIVSSFLRSAVFSCVSPAPDPSSLFQHHPMPCF